MVIKKVCFFLALTTLGYSGWNEEFDSKSLDLQNSFQIYQDAGYRQHYLSFIETKESLLFDQTLVEKIDQALPEEKLMLFRGDVICKKRRYGNVKEFLVWEIAYLLGGAEFISPAYPVEIAGKKIIIQKRQNFIIGRGPARYLSREVLSQISLESYWKMHLIGYILGLKDLVGRNIGVMSNGGLLLFDTEASFLYKVDIQLEPFDTQFAAQSFDWPHYRIAISPRVAKGIKTFIKGLDGFERQLDLYMQYRELPFDKNDLLARLKKVRSFSLKEGKSFHHFYSFLFPKRVGGEKTLTQLIGGFQGRKIGYGEALCFLTAKHKIKNLSPIEIKAIQKWVDRYIE